MKVLLLEGIDPLAEQTLKERGFAQVEYLAEALDEKELVSRYSDFHVLGIRSCTQITPTLLDQLPQLMAIGCFCIGTNQVDLQASAQKGIPVFNAPHGNTRSVAEMVLGLTIMLVRHLFPKSVAAHDGRWLKSSLGCQEVRGKTIGIVGYGHIGSQTSVLAEALGMNVLFFDPQPKLPLGNARAVKSLHDLLKQSDIVTLHVPEAENTSHMMNSETLSVMKQGAYLINASRGTVVDLEALRASLEAEHLRGAAIDVFPAEPKEKGAPFESSMRGVPNVILTPHVGGSTVEAQQNIARDVVGKVGNYCEQGTTVGAVNFPEAALSTQKNGHRLLHTHSNIPGVLQKINTCIANEQVNVIGQHLMTRNDVGYAVLDVEGGITSQMLQDLQNIEGTIRLRNLENHSPVSYAEL